MLVGLESQVKHLTSLITLLVDQLVANGQEAREAGLDNVVKVLSVGTIRRFEPERAADGKEALKAGENGTSIVCVEEFGGKVHKVGPSAGEVGLQNALDDRNELLADEGIRVCEKRHEAVSDAGLFLLGDDGCSRGLGRVPRTIDSVLEVDYG